jgi:hypothetical protein
MPKSLPSDDEIRAGLRRNRPFLIVEAVGCVVVLACALGGATLGFLVFDALDDRDPLRPSRVGLWLLCGGALAGFVLGVLLVRGVRWLSRSRAGRSG